MLRMAVVGAILAASSVAHAQTPAAPAAAAPSAATLADAYYQFVQARTLEGANDLNGAAAAYRKAIALAPGAADIHADLAELYATNGHVSEAMPELDAALKIDPANRLANRLYGLIDAAVADNAPPAQKAGLVNDAIRYLEQARAASVGHDLNVLLTLGRLYLDTHQFDKSIAALKDFLIDEPDYPDALTTLSEDYEAANRVGDAIATLEHLISLDPTLEVASSELADLYEQVGRWSDAAARWESLAKASPQNASRYQVRRATDLINDGDLDAARPVLLALTSANGKDSGAWYLLAQLEKRAGHAQAIESAARQLLSLDPDDPRGTIALADARTLAHDAKGAVALLQPLYEKTLPSSAPDSPLAAVTDALSAALEDSGDKARALQVVEDARRQHSGDEDLAFTLSNAYERAGKLDDAEAVLRDVIAKQPQDAAALNSLGYLLADHGRKLDDAVGLIQRALAIESDNPSYLDSLGWAYYKQGRYTDAVAPLEHAAGALVRNSVIQAHLGELYFQLKRYLDAANAWTRALDGDHSGIDVAAVTKKRDHARELAK
jgi:tetratricopeptide (TPR) repeat protein